MGALPEAGVPTMGLPADEIMLDGRGFDPAALVQALAEVPKGRGRWPAVARLLNGRVIPNPGSGQVRTVENARKVAKSTVSEPV